MIKRLLLVLIWTVLLLVGCDKNSTGLDSSAASESVVQASDSAQAVSDGSSVAESVKPTFTKEELDEAKKQAELLTAHLIDGSLLSTALDGETAPSQREINNFVLWTVRFLESPNYLFYDFFSKTEDALYLFPLKNVQQIVHEVFGVEDWVLESSSLNFNEQKQQYESGLEYEIGGAFSFENLTLEIIEDTAKIETTFLLTDRIGFKGEPGWNEHGYYTITFQVMREQERVFLRYIEIKAAEQG